MLRRLTREKLLPERFPQAARIGRPAELPTLLSLPPGFRYKPNATRAFGLRLARSDGIHPNTSGSQLFRQSHRDRVYRTLGRRIEATSSVPDSRWRSN